MKMSTEKRVNVAVIAASGLILATLAPHPASAQRRYVDVDMSQPRVWTRQSVGSDTTLIDPNRILAVDGKLIITDPRAPAVIALDERSGRTLWRYAPRRGNGPGEMLLPDGVASNPRGIIISDNFTHRLYLLSEATGQLLAEQMTPLGSFVGEMCSEMDGTVILNIATFHGTSLIAAVFGSSRSQPLVFPFDTGSAATGLDLIVDMSQIHAGENTWHCFAARKSADGIAMLPALKTTRAKPFIERVHQRASKPAKEVRDTADLPIPFSLRTGELDGMAWVWFGGSACSYKCIDFYTVPDLNYMVTARIVNHMGINLRDIAIDGDRMFVLGTIDGAPTVTSIPFPGAAIH